MPNKDKTGPNGDGPRTGRRGQQFQPGQGNGQGKEFGQQQGNGQGKGQRRSQGRGR